MLREACYLQELGIIRVLGLGGEVHWNESITFLKQDDWCDVIRPGWGPDMSCRCWRTRLFGCLMRWSLRAQRALCLRESHHFIVAEINES